jgi:glycosyltransferase involved in cell wall biosynthesis
MKVVVTIAVLNEAKNLGEVLSAMPADVDVIVVDDGSTDGSVQVCIDHGARVIRHASNLGQGSAVITGFKACLMGDWDYIIEMDGDGQHDPSDIPRFVEALESGGDDIVVGSRILGSDYAGAPFFRRLFLPAYTNVINRASGYQLTDSMCGYRAFRASSLRSVQHIFSEMAEPQYLAAEMFIRFGRENLTVSEIPINMSDRTSGVSRKGLFKYGWGVARAILKTTLRGKT